MKDGYVLPENEQISDEEIKCINKFTKRDLSKDEIYVFSVVLCDNEIDREYEKFTNDSLNKLSHLFVGKPGILDHDAKSEKQLARIFSCKTEIFKKKNSVDENYCRLVARSYIPKTKSSEELILQIDSGIKKEVSIRCLIQKNLCSICGENIKICDHEKGKKYGIDESKKLCYSILENPVDAYEWSFVAIPSQVSAGVIKTFENTKNENNSILEKLKNESKGKMNEIIKNLENEVKIGQKYTTELRNDVLKMFLISEPQIDNSVIKKMVNTLNFDELQTLKKKFSDSLQGNVQLSSCDDFNQNKYSEFKV